MLCTNEADVSLFTTYTSTPCAFNIIPSDLETESQTMYMTIPITTPAFIFIVNINTDTFGDAHVQYHDFDNSDAFVYKDKYTALLQQELQNPYWCFHDPITTKSSQISSDMDIESMPYAMYFTGNTGIFTKINHVPY